MSKKGVDLTLIVAALLLTATIFAISSFKHPTITGAPIGVGGGGGSECLLCYPWKCYNGVSCSNKCGGSQTCIESKDICCDLCPSNDYTCIETNQTTLGKSVSSGGKDLASYCTETGAEQCDGFDNDCDGIIDELCDKDQDAYCDNTMRYRKDTGEQPLSDTTFNANTPADVYASTVTYFDNKTGKTGLYVKNLQTNQSTLIAMGTDLPAPAYTSLWAAAIYQDKVAWLNLSTMNPFYKYDLFLTNTTTGQTWVLAKDLIRHTDYPDMYGNYVVYDSDNPDSSKSIVQLINISNPAAPLYKNVTAQYKAWHPRIDRDLVVWSDDRLADGNDQVYLYNITSGIERKLTSAERNTQPDIYQDSVVWLNWSNPMIDNPKIALYNVTSNKRTMIIPNGSSTRWPRIYQNYIVYDSVVNGRTNIYFYHTLSKTTALVANSTGLSGHPSIYDRLVTWYNMGWTHNYRDLSPGPICLQGDCNDRNVSISPAGTEDPTCNNVDENCNGMVDEGCNPCLTALDSDADGYKKDSYREEVASNTSYGEGYPDAYQNLIAYISGKSGNSNIYLYNLTNRKEIQVTNNPPLLNQPRLYKDAIVYFDARNGNYDVYLYNITSKTETRITNNAADQYRPALYENYIVWVDGRNYDALKDTWDVYSYDLKTGTEKRITKNATAFMSASTAPVDIFGDYIVWADQRSYPFTIPPSADIYLYDITNGTEKKISQQSPYSYMPTTDGDYVAWPAYGGKIYLYDPRSQKESLLLTRTTPPGGSTPPIRLRQKSLIYDSYEQNRQQLHLKNILTDTDKKLTMDDYDHYLPSIWQDLITYVHAGGATGQDVYYLNTSVGACGDCNDANSSIKPGINETCGDQIDNNCNGMVDEGCTPCSTAPDSDADGYKADSWEEKIASNAPQHQDRQDSYGNLITYMDFRNSQWDIYYYDINTKSETQVTNDAGPQGWPAIWKDAIVYEDATKGATDHDIWIYNITTGIRTQITSDAQFQSRPDIYENYITWTDTVFGSGNVDLILYDLKTGTKRKITDTPTVHPIGEGNAHIHTNLVVWSDDKTGKTNIYLYDILNNRTRQVTNVDFSWGPDTYQNTITWYDQGIWKRTYNSDSGTLGPAKLILNKSDVSQQARIYSNYIIYATSPLQPTQGEIYLKDHNTGITKKLTHNALEDLSPTLYGDLVAYVKNDPATLHDVYYLNLSENYTCGDCDDDNTSIKPGINETCYDGIDNNCNGIVDEGCIPLECQNSTDTDADTYKADFYEEMPATTDPDQQQGSEVYKNLITYRDSRNGNWDIYYYDLSTQTETRVTSTPSEDTDPYIYKDAIVYQRQTNGTNIDIWMYNITTGTFKQITNRSGIEETPVMYENYITWYDLRNTIWYPGLGEEGYDIYYYDLKNNTEWRVTKNASASKRTGARFINIHNKLITWTDIRNSNHDIYLYDLNKNKEKQVTNLSDQQENSDVYQNTIVWRDWRPGGVGIWKRTYNPAIQTLGPETQVVNSSTAYQPRINNNRVTYFDQRYSPDIVDEIFLTDLLTGKEKRITKNNQSDFSAAINGDIVTYTKLISSVPSNTDVYYVNLSQEVMCGDCDDMNASVNVGKVENVSLTNDSNTCQNNIDDDCDGLIDCLDPSCEDSPPCGGTCIPEGPTETKCDDFIDNDCDELIDCLEPPLGPDLDCLNKCGGNATLHGYVFDDTIWPIDLATVTGYPPFKPIVTTFTNINGFYNYTVPSGKYNFKADKFGYDPDIDELALPNGTDMEHNFTLHNATCHNDCTNSEGRCNKDCEGYTYQGDSCHFNTTTIANACQDKRRGTTQTLQENQTWFVFIDCCEGTPYYQWKPQLTITGPMEDLYKLTSIVSIGGDPAKLHVNVWRK